MLHIKFKLICERDKYAGSVLYNDKDICQQTNWQIRIMRNIPQQLQASFVGSAMHAW